MNAITPGLRKTLGYLILSGLGLYVILSLLLIVFPDTVIISRKLTRYYHWLAMPGPFFKENRIQTPGHFYVSYKKADSTWSQFRNPEREEFQQYCHSIFDYNSLQQSRIAHHLANTLYRTLGKSPELHPHSRAVRQMQAYLRPEYIPADADSIKMVYFRDESDGDVKRKETLFALTYKSF